MSCSAPVDLIDDLVTSESEERRTARTKRINPCWYVRWQTGLRREATPEYRILGSPRRIHGVLRILSAFYRIREYTEYRQNTDHVFWWTEYLVFCTYYVYSLPVDIILYSVKTTEYGQNTDGIRTEYRDHKKSDCDNK